MFQRIARTFRTTRSLDAPKPRRLLADAKDRIDAYIEAAKEYPHRLPNASHSWLYMKPYEWSDGHKEFFYNMHNALGLVQAMKLNPASEVLEVGCGPGWLTEILAMLGYRVTSLDPAPRLAGNRAPPHRSCCGSLYVAENQGPSPSSVRHD